MKNNPKKLSPSAATCSQSLRSGQRTFIKRLAGNTQRKPIPQRRIASATGSAPDTRYRVIAAAVPPSELDSSAKDTPIHSPTLCSLTLPHHRSRILVQEKKRWQDAAISAGCLLHIPSLRMAGSVSRRRQMAAINSVHRVQEKGTSMTHKSNPSIIRSNPPELGTPPGYSQIVDVTANRIIFISGQTALDRDGNLVG